MSPRKEIIFLQTSGSGLDPGNGHETEGQNDRVQGNMSVIFSNFG